MFSEIEKEYQRGLPEKRFIKYYCWRVVPIVLIAFLVIAILGFDSHLVAIVAGVLLLLLALWFIIRDIRTTMGKHANKKSFSSLLVAYLKNDDNVRLGNLILDLKKHHICTKDDLKLALEYFEKRQPVSTKPSLLEWTLSVVIALAPVIILAYDDATQTIDRTKLLAVLVPTMEVTLSVIMPIIVIKAITAHATKSRAKTDALLMEDLAFLYVNFDQYKDNLK